MKSSHLEHPSAAVSAARNGGGDLRGAVLRIKRQDMFAISFSEDEAEIALSTAAVAEIGATLKTSPRYRNYHTVAEEAKRLQISEKTLRMLLKQRRAPHYVLGSDIRIDPEAIDAWMDSNYATRPRNPTV